MSFFNPLSKFAHLYIKAEPFQGDLEVTGSPTFEPYSLTSTLRAAKLLHERGLMTPELLASLGEAAKRDPESHPFFSLAEHGLSDEERLIRACRIFNSLPRSDGHPSLAHWLLAEMEAGRIAPLNMAVWLSSVPWPMQFDPFGEDSLVLMELLKQTKQHKNRRKIAGALVEMLTVVSTESPDELAKGRHFMRQIGHLAHPGYFEQKHPGTDQYEGPMRVGINASFEPYPLSISLPAAKVLAQIDCLSSELCTGLGIAAIRDGVTSGPLFDLAIQHDLTPPELEALVKEAAADLPADPRNTAFAAWLVGEVDAGRLGPIDIAAWLRDKGDWDTEPLDEETSLVLAELWPPGSQNKRRIAEVLMKKLRELTNQLWTD